ncbi:MAG: magnesium transporter [Chloroflexi bacterium]|nr:magnesium transporter [Chloroflexota bacterium]
MPESAKNRNLKLRGLTHKIPVVLATYTLAETQALLFARKGQFDTIDYIYVTDADGRLVGVFSIKEIYNRPLSTNVSTLYKKSPVTARLRSHPEEIAELAVKHDIKAIPIVDEHKKLLGIVPHDTIKRVLHKELREDLFLLAGVSREHLAFESILEESLIQAVRHRLPWLLIGTLGGLTIAQIIGQFEETLQKNLVLAAFIPLVVYIADAVGTQLEAFAIRDFALFRQLNFARYFIKHFLTVLSLAISLGVIVSLIGLALYRQASLAAVLGLTVAGAIMSALFSGLLVPFFFRKMGADPANASGPLGTIIQDALSVVIYFSIASLLM